MMTRERREEARRTMTAEDAQREREGGGEGGRGGGGGGEREREREIEEKAGRAASPRWSARAAERSASCVLVRAFPNEQARLCHCA